MLLKARRTRSGTSSDGDDDGGDSDDDGVSGSDGDDDDVSSISSNEVTGRVGFFSETSRWSSSPLSIDEEEAVAVASISDSQRHAVTPEVMRSGGDDHDDSSELRALRELRDHWPFTSPASSTAAWIRGTGHRSPASLTSSRVGSASSSLGYETHSPHGASSQESSGGSDNGDGDSSDDERMTESMAQGECSRPRRFSASSFTSTGTWVAGNARRGRVSTFRSGSESSDSMSSQNSFTLDSAAVEGRHYFVEEPYSLNGVSSEGVFYSEDLEENYSDTNEGVQVDDDEDYDFEECDSVC
jgi:hypothetical protein